MPFSPVQLPLSYQFEILTPAGARVYLSPLIAGGSGATISHSPNAQLNVDQTYLWRVRAVYDEAMGPHSANATFVASRPAAFMNATTIWDPLDNGQTIGTIHGVHTWIPGVGLRLDEFESHVTYELPNGGRIEEGEFSAIISGIPRNSEGDKTKLISMSSGYHDLATNESRFTLERRGDGCDGSYGCIAWRFITTGGETGSVGNHERAVLPWTDDVPYFYQFSWRHGIARIAIHEIDQDGPEFYEHAKGYDGFYNPVPHVIILGSTHSRSGAPNWTVPGMIVRKVWASWDPRPAYAR